MFITARIAFIFVSSTAIHINDFHISTVTKWVYFSGTSIITSSRLACYGRVLHWYRRGHGFKSRTSLNFFQASFHSYLSSDHNCEDRFQVRWSFPFERAQWAMFLSHKFLYTNYRLSIRTSWKKIYGRKKGTAKRTQEARYSRTQIITLKAMTRSTFWISVALFFHKLWNTLFHIIRSWLFTHQVLFYCYFNRTVPQESDRRLLQWLESCWLPDGVWSCPPSNP